VQASAIEEVAREACRAEAQALFAAHRERSAATNTSNTSSTESSSSLPPAWLIRSYFDSFTGELDGRYYKRKLELAAAQDALDASPVAAAATAVDAAVDLIHAVQVLQLEEVHLEDGSTGPLTELLTESPSNDSVNVRMNGDSTSTSTNSSSSSSSSVYANGSASSDSTVCKLAALKEVQEQPAATTVPTAAATKHYEATHSINDSTATTAGDVDVSRTSTTTESSDVTSSSSASAEQTTLQLFWRAVAARREGAHNTAHALFRSAAAAAEPAAAAAQRAGRGSGTALTVAAAASEQAASYAYLAGDMYSAEAAFAAAAALDESCSRARIKLASLLCDMDRREEALHWFQLAIQVY
jgi:tetratricopeptide (TPR) repeat protein